MPIHDWTRVAPGIFHDFHNAWVMELRNGRVALGEKAPEIVVIDGGRRPSASKLKLESAVVGRF